MASEVLDLTKEGVSFLTSYQDDSRWESCEITSSLDKLAKSINEGMELRAAVFHQQGEKVQQIQQAKLQKLTTEEELYIQKCNAIEKNMTDCLSQIRDVEYSIFEIKNKISVEEGLNEKLKEETMNLKTEKDDLNSRIQQTYSLYLSVIECYETYLRIHIDICRESGKIFKFYFSNKKNYNTSPYVKFEILEDFQFKVLEVHPDLEGNKENMQQVYSQRELISLVYNAMQALINQRKSVKKVAI